MAFDSHAKPGTAVGEEQMTAGNEEGEALNWWRAAAEGGHPKAQYNLGFFAGGGEILP